MTRPGRLGVGIIGAGKVGAVLGAALRAAEHAVVGVSNRILVLNFGETIAEGPPQEVLRNPAVVAAYLGDDIEEEA